MTDKDYLPFMLPQIEADEIEEVVETLKSGWITTGPRVKKFEQDFAEYVGASHAVAVNSCTAALHLSLDAIGLSEGDEVIVPTMTFAATAEVVCYFKAKPVLVDCRLDTMNIDPEKIEAAITDRTRAIIPVHFAGQPCEMDKIIDIAKRHDLKVIEDAAHALPARYNDELVGSIGDITCFSFYATKTITTGEGGMITTENPDFAEKMRMMSLHGISHDAWKRYSATGSWRYDICFSGFKYNMTDIAAALGIHQLKKCDRFRKIRENYASLYTAAFQDMPEIRLPVQLPQADHAWHLYVLQLDLERLTIDRDRFLELLKEEGIGASVHFIPLHMHTFYKETFSYREEDLPNASQLAQCIVSLPLYPGMKSQDVERVIDVVTSTVNKHKK